MDIISGMKRNDAGQKTDAMGNVIALLLALLFAGVIMVQVALTSPFWRAKLSPVDVFEGVRLENSYQEWDGDLPSAARIW